LAASSEAPMGSSLSQKVIPSILPLWRSPRALSPLNPSSCLDGCCEVFMPTAP
jgi:hypothetical protein